MQHICRALTAMYFDPDKLCSPDESQFIVMDWLRTTH